MKRVLFYLTRYPGIGGIENVTSHIVGGLQARYDCTILSHLHQDMPCNFPIVHFPEEAYDTPANREFFDKFLSEGNFDVVVYQDSYAPTELLVTDGCQKHKVTLLVFEHNSPLFIENKRALDPWYASVKSLMRRALHPLLMRRERQRKRLLLDAAERYVLLSREFIKDFARMVGVSANHPKLMAIHNPISTPPPCASIYQQIKQLQGIALCRKVG